MMPKFQVPKRSPIWIYFNALSNDVSKCTICGVVISTKGGSTSNLRRHLKGKHRKIIIDRTKSKRVKQGRKGDNMGKMVVEEQDDEEEVIVVKNFEGNSFHSDLFHNYAAVDDGFEQQSQNEASSSEWEDVKSMNKSSTHRQTLSQMKSHKKVENIEHGIGKVKNTVSSSTPSKSNTNDHNLEIFTEIALNLGRIATAFERIADFICTDRNQKRYSCDSNVRTSENTNDELGAKVNDMILNVLGEDIVNGSDIEYNIEDHNHHTNKKLKISSVLKSLNLLPKNETINKACKTTAGSET